MGTTGIVGRYEYEMRGQKGKGMEGRGLRGLFNGGFSGARESSNRSECRGGIVPSTIEGPGGGYDLTWQLS